MDVSIIIVNWNTHEILRDCLESVFKNIATVKAEVIVIDNASSDGSAEMVRNQFAKVRLIENTENRGFAAANNQGMYIARGRYILLLNSDTVVLGNAIGKTVAFADENERAAVVACQVLNRDLSIQRTCFMFPSLINMVLSTTYLYKLFPRSRFFGRERMTWWGRDDVREVDVVTGCFMLVRREALDAVGVMDERFFMYGEETDWCKRFKDAGWKVVFSPVGQIIHLGGQSARKQAGPMLLQLKGSILLYFKKHRSRAAYMAACILTGCFFLLRLPGWAMMSLIKPWSKGIRTYCYFYAQGAVRAMTGARGLCARREA